MALVNPDWLPFSASSSFFFFLFLQSDTKFMVVEMTAKSVLYVFWHVQSNTATMDECSMCYRCFTDIH